MTGIPGLQLPNRADTLLLRAALYPDARGLEAWLQLRPHFSVDRAHPGQWSLLPLVHRTLCHLDVRDPDRERLAGLRRFLRVRWARLEGPLAGGLRRLEEAGIPVMLLREAARAQRLDGDDRSLRDLSEIALLRPASASDRVAPLIGGTDPILLVDNVSDRLAVPGPGGDPAWQLAEPTSLAGCAVLRPCATDLLLHTLVEGTRFADKGRLRWAADAALLIAAGGIDWQRLSHQAEQRRVALTTARALEYLASELEVALPPELPARFHGARADWRERLINSLGSPAAQGPSHRNSVALVLAQSAAQPPPTSLWGLGCRVAGGCVRTLVSEGRHGFQVLKRIRRPAPQFGTALDQPPPERFTGTVLVASTQRSGSTLLCSALERTGLVGVPREYLHPDFFESGHRVMRVPRPTPREQLRRLGRRLRLCRKWWGYWEIEPSTMAPYVQALVARRSTANGLFSIKIQWDAFERARRMGFCLTQLPQPITWIHIERRDRIAQAVSFDKAIRSGAFLARDEKAHSLDRLFYDDGALLGRYQWLQQSASAWNRYFEAEGIIPVSVVYEDLAADYEYTIRRVLAALSFEDVPVPPPMLKRQANALNQRWIAAFLRNHPELLQEP